MCLHIHAAIVHDMRCIRSSLLFNDFGLSQQRDGDDARGRNSDSSRGRKRAAKHVDDAINDSDTLMMAIADYALLLSDSNQNCVFY